MSGVAVTGPTYARADAAGRARTARRRPAPATRGPASDRWCAQFGWTNTATVRAGTENELLPGSYAACLTTLSAPLAWTGLSRTVPVRPVTFCDTASGVALK